MRCLRLKKQKEITAVLKNGRRAHAATLTVVYFPSDRLKMAVCVGKKFGKSVKRNRLKRLLRAAFSQYSDSLAPASFLLIPKVSETYAFSSFSKDLKKIFERERLIVQH